MFEINGIYWNVIYVDPDNDNLRRSDGSITLGVTDLDTKTVYINNRLRGALLRKVMLHEICHCFIFSTGIYFDLVTEEIVCDFVATWSKDMFDIVDMLLDSIRLAVL